jgi:ABC-2 type transport system ATP-binding protein
MNGNAAALELDAVTIAYGGKPLLRDVSLGIVPGTVYALLGRNGAGKSSLVRILLGLQRPEAGRALVFGRDPWRERASLMDRIGVVPEAPDAPSTASADLLSAFCGRVHRRWDADAVARRLDRLGVPRRRPFGKLSKGEKGSVHFALALGASPDLLVLDDPTLGLDPVARHELFGDLIGELADRGTTVFLTTHDLAGVEGIADRVGILAGGRLAIDADLEELKARFRRITYSNEITPSRESYGTELDLFDAARVRVRGWGVEAVVTNFDDARFERFRTQEGISTAAADPMSLEEIFLAVAGVRDREERKAS